MATSNKNEALILAITEGGMTPTEAAEYFHVTPRWTRTLLARYHEGGIEALQPRSRRPHSNPNATSLTVQQHILDLREELTRTGLDAGAESIHARLPPTQRPSITTIWRILKRHNHVTPQPQKRPRSSWKRFEAAQPNETWQSDFTHWNLADDTITEIIGWLDDHSRYLLHLSAHPRITGTLVIDTFTQACHNHGYPASTLTDNGMVYTTRFARGAEGKRAQPNGYEHLLNHLGITQKNGAANHPTTQGKIERFHQTLKRWLTAQPRATTLKQLNTQLTEFTHIYNTQRPHRALHHRTPHQAYTALPKAEPTQTLNHKTWRTRHDKVDKTGRVTLRYAGKLRHLAIGRAHIGAPILILIHDRDTLVINRTTGEIIAEHTLNPNTNYQHKRPPTTQ